MKLYAVDVRDGTVSLVAVDAIEAPTSYEIEGESAGRPWFYKRTLDKQHDWRMIHLSPRQAVEAFIDSQVRDRDRAIRLLDVMQRFLLEAACDDQVAAEQPSSNAVADAGGGNANAP
jgi:hypothetical protein